MATRWFIVLSCCLWAADQVSKFLARQLMTADDLQRLIAGEIGAVRNEIIPDFFYLTLNFNKGIAWGMLPHWSEYFTYFAIIMVLVILMILGKLEKDEVWLKVALSFQMAGALGNMTDRLVMSRVTDFIDLILFHGTKFQYDWPIFNLADSFVVVGTIVLVTVLLFSRDSKPEPSLALSAAGAGKISAGPGLGNHPEEARNEAEDEALIELPIEEDGLLIPFEDADLVREEITESIGSDASEDAPSEPDSLDELDRRPSK
ncbi:MAG TPA: signal peptidase II [bacterium]